MAQFSKDVDLLKWEPVLFTELALASQTLISGTNGSISGTTFESMGTSFDTSGVNAGHVIHLCNVAGDIDGCYEIVSVDSATQLTISVVRSGEDTTAIAPPTGTELSYRISTFDPQAQEAAESLLQYFGISLNDDSTSINSGDIADDTVLRQASVFAVLSAMFASSATGKDDYHNFWQKSLRYQQLFYTARVKIRLGINFDNDSMAEQIRLGGAVRLRRL